MIVTEILVNFSDSFCILSLLLSPARVLIELIFYFVYLLMFILDPDKMLELIPLNDIFN